MAKILVVDDHPINRQLLLTLLGYSGHRLLEAGNGAEALELVRVACPDLVISDILMPTMDGYEFVRQLRADPAIAHTSIIFYTANYREREARALASTCGVSHILVKPCDPEDILRTVDAVLGRTQPTVAPPTLEEFDRQHLRLLTDKLNQKVTELEQEVTERRQAEEELRTAHEQLEARVQERTAELAQANEELQVEITERKRSEEALRESQQMLQLVMDNIPQFIFWKDRNFVFLGCNRNFAQLAGVGSPKNIVGKTDYDMPWKKEANLYRECDCRVMETDTPEYHIIEPLLRADGQQAWLDTNKVPLHDLEGNVVGILGTFEDITEHKQNQEALSESQRKLATLIDSLPGIVFSCANDPEWSLTYLSEGCFNLTGYTNEELSKNGAAPYNSIIHAQDLQNVLKAITVSIALKQPYVVEYRIHNKSGEEKWVWEKGTGVFDINGEVLSLEGFIIDITERKRAEAALSESKKRLQQQNTNLSH